MRLPRSSGVLLHPTSLPGPFGVGDLGPSSYRFIEFLGQAGQRWWQMLPVNPITGPGFSPYQALSSFAGSPLLLSPELLRDQGLLTDDDLAAGADEAADLGADAVDYDAAIVIKDRLLKLAFRRFSGGDPWFAAFTRRHAGWLDDFALFLALKEEEGGRAWTDWPPALAARDPEALAEARARLAGAIQFHKFAQFQFARQWNALRQECRRHGVQMIGDLPIYVAGDSADVWTRPDLFELDAVGLPSVVAGVPPDQFEPEFGQYWGNPLYRWQEHATDGYAWWTDRMRATTLRFDLVRLDHFRGFEAYWEVPSNPERSAKGGRWVSGPGAALLDALKKGLQGLPLIAEDLGLITPDVIALRDQFQLPGMRVLQFAFSPHADDERPHTMQHHSVVYTGTHDNDTTRGWFLEGPSGRQALDPIALRKASDEIKRRNELVLDYLGFDDGPARSAPGVDVEVARRLVRLGMASVADTAITPLQDLLALGTDARMNQPGDAGPWWRWRFRDAMLTTDVLDELRKLTITYGRGRPSPTSTPTDPAGVTRASTNLSETDPA
jgi:4-alpha-glucanotransferase